MLLPRLRIAINAQLLPDNAGGGIVTVLRALTALTELQEGTEEYVFVGPYEDPEWLRPMLPPGQQIVRGPQFMSPAGWRADSLEPFKQKLGPVRPLVRGVKQFLTAPVAAGLRAAQPESKFVKQFATASGRSFFQSLNCDVIHFPFQSFDSCGLPSVYNPHDLQHLHLPHFFAPSEVTRRENLYPMACRMAHTVVVASEFVKRDLVEHYGIEPSKVQVIPWAPPPLPKDSPETCERLSRELQAKYDVAGKPFALYPAMTWEHKNHVRLLEAVAYLRDSERLKVRVICTGFKTKFWPLIEKRLGELDLHDAVKFPGLIAPGELNALYRAAQFVFVPTLFEALSAPVFEAWQHGTPVACSTVTSLPEQVADAALVFDPTSVIDIAAALARMTTDSNLREELTRRGAVRLKDFSLARTAKAYRAVYRRAAGRQLTCEDQELLAHDWSQKSRTPVEVVCE